MHHGYRALPEEAYPSYATNPTHTSLGTIEKGCQRHFFPTEIFSDAVICCGPRRDSVRHANDHFPLRPATLKVGKRLFGFGEREYLVNDHLYLLRVDESGDRFKIGAAGVHEQVA